MLKRRRRYRSSTLGDMPKIKEIVVWKIIGKDKLIIAALNMESGFLHMFEGASARIWQLLDGRRTVNQIISVIQEEFPGISQNDVMKFISKLREDELIRTRDLWEAQH